MLCSKKSPGVALHTGRSGALNRGSPARDKQKVPGWDKGVKTPAGTRTDVPGPAFSTGMTEEGGGNGIVPEGKIYGGHMKRVEEQVQESSLLKSQCGR